jgi:HK97 family phage major capsid protein
MSDVTSEDIAALNERIDAAKELIASTHMPSKAGLGLVKNNGWDAKATPELPGGDWITAVMQSGSRLASEQELGKATLDLLGSAWLAADPTKATLGTTPAGGGFIVPMNLVAELQKVANYGNPFRSLLTVRTASGQAVDQPYRAGAPGYALIAPVGDLKQKLDLTYSSYTATMYTLARLYELSTRFVRTSAGAAEADVLGTLAQAFALGESHYIVNGTGTGEPFGILPAIASAAPLFDSTFTGATTLLGSVAAGIATAAGALAVRNQKATAAVMNPSDYWLMWRQGADTAGFYASGPSSSPLNIDPTGAMTIWGIPVIPDNNIPSDTLLIGNFKAANLYIGAGYRVETDSSGTRFDYNLIAFRGEEDLAFDARPAVAVGAFARIVDLHA